MYGSHRVLHQNNIIYRRLRGAQLIRRFLMNANFLTSRRSTLPVIMRNRQIYRRNAAPARIHTATWSAFKVQTSTHECGVFGPLVDAWSKTPYQIAIATSPHRSTIPIDACRFKMHTDSNSIQPPRLKQTEFPSKLPWTSTLTDPSPLRCNGAATH